MTANSKSLILLAATLVVGFALGLFADATLVRTRQRQLGGLRGPPGFVDHMIETVIQPHSDAQRDSIKPIVERTAQRNVLIARDLRDRLRAGFDSMRTALAPMLDSAQRDRLAAEVSHMPAFGPGGRGRGRGGPPPFGPPGSGRGGPPGEGPPPPAE
jgi:tetrahydromethanopterin S-methyltransferase subunit F